MINLETFCGSNESDVQYSIKLVELMVVLNGIIRGWFKFMNRIWVYICLSTAFIGTLTFPGCEPGPRSAAPNLLLITLDTTRADRLGCYGYTGGQTPALDSLAASGCLFEQAWTASPR
jgi:Sulfatase